MSEKSLSPAGMAFHCSRISGNYCSDARFDSTLSAAKYLFFMKSPVEKLAEVNYLGSDEITQPETTYDGNSSKMQRNPLGIAPFLLEHRCNCRSSLIRAGRLAPLRVFLSGYYPEPGLLSAQNRCRRSKWKTASGAVSTAISSETARSRKKSPGNPRVPPMISWEEKSPSWVSSLS